jgi:transposase
MKPLVTNELWAMVGPLLPRRRAQPKGGRPWVDDRETLNGILYVLRSGIPWRMLPPELGYGSGVTCWRRLREWQQRGVWRRLHQVMLDRLAAADRIDWTRAALLDFGHSGRGGDGLAELSEDLAGQFEHVVFPRGCARRDGGAPPVPTNCG